MQKNKNLFFINLLKFNHDYYQEQNTAIHGNIYNRRWDYSFRSNFGRAELIASTWLNKPGLFLKSYRNFKITIDRFPPTDCWPPKGH
jgi:hypothetical protein